MFRPENARTLVHQLEGLGKGIKLLNYKDNSNRSR